MNRVKFAAGLLIMLGLPLAFGIVFGGLGYGYAHQHVHNVWAELGANNVSVVRTEDYDHSSAGIAATVGVLVFFWTLLSTCFVLAGGKMIASRNKNWA